MNYEEAMNAIRFNNVQGSILGIETMGMVLEHLGNPQDKLKVIHVAGTNGKGSTCNYIYNILVEAGYKVGLYTSPSLNEFNDRMQINHEYISDEDLIAVAEDVKARLQDIKVEPTEFEWITTLAFQYFSQQECDFLVLEVGLGGRLDATNLVKKPLLSVITAIGMDHQDFLGDTIAKVANEKAGIIKPEVPVVLYPIQEPDVMEVIKTKSTEHNAELIIPDSEELEINSTSRTEQSFSYKHLNDVRMRILGVNQFYNAMVAVEAVLTLNSRYQLSISDEHIKTGIYQSQWAGRFEQLSEEPVIIVDGAHNPQGIQSLLNNIETFYPDTKITAVIGVLKDKALAEMIHIIDSVVNRYLVVAPESDRRFTPEEMEQAIGENSDKTVFVKEDLKSTLEFAIETTPTDEIIVCFGSLYLIAECREVMAQIHEGKVISE